MRTGGLLTRRGFPAAAPVRERRKFHCPMMPNTRSVAPVVGLGLGNLDPWWDSTLQLLGGLRNKC
jgi:hypothetical protein